MSHSLPLLQTIGEADLNQLMEWLTQAAQILEGEQSLILDMLEQDPHMLQWLASVTTVLSATSDASQNPLSSDGQTMKPAEVLTKMVWLQQLRHQLANGRPTPEVLGKVRTIQQALEPLLKEGRGQARNMLTQAGEQTSQHEISSKNQPHVKAEFFNRNHGQHTEQTSKPQANLALRQDAEPTDKSAVKVTVRHSALPRPELLRPELLSLAMHEAIEATPGEGKMAEAVLSNPSVANDLVKATANLSEGRMPTMQQVPAEQFVQEMNKFVIRAFQVNQLNGVSEARISLVPEHLGHVDIKLTMQNGQLTATLVTETVMGKELLEQQLGQLRAVLQGQGIQVEKLEVTNQSNSASTAFFRDHDHSQGSRQFEQRSQSKVSTYEEDTVEFAHDLEYVQDEYETIVGGRSFHATA